MEQVEVAVLFDEWEGAPLSALEACIEHAVCRTLGKSVSPSGRGNSLVGILSNWQKLLGVTFIILFGRFERYLAAPRDTDAAQQFEGAFVDALKQPVLPAKFLVSVTEDAESRLREFLVGVPGLGEASVRLPLYEAAWQPQHRSKEHVDGASPIDTTALLATGCSPPRADRDRSGPVLGTNPQTNGGLAASPLTTSNSERASREDQHVADATRRTRQDEAAGIQDTERRRRLRKLTLLSLSFAAVLSGLAYFVATSVPRSPGSGAVTHTEAIGASAKSTAAGTDTSQAWKLDARQNAKSVGADLSTIASKGAIDAKGLTEAAEVIVDRWPPHTSADSVGQAHTPNTRPPASANASRPSAATLDEAYKKRVSRECHDGLRGFVCREAIRFELCDSQWSSVATKGRTVCHVRPVAPAASD